MIVQKEFLKKVKDFGLNTYEAKIWTALLSRGISTAGELSDIANVPRSRSYDILESLEKKGFIIMKIGKPIKYIAVPPTEVMERVKKRIMEDAQNQAKVLDELKNSEILTELTTLHTQGVEHIEPTDMTGSLKGRDNLYNHLDLLIKDAKKSVIIVTSENGLARKAENLKRSLKKAAERGVKIKIAAPITNNNKTTANTLKAFAEIRNVKDVKARFCIVDEEQIVFMLADDSSVHPSYDVGIWANTPLFSQALTQMFNTHWEKARTANV
jgi:sugar-specific transcriptional regulator TrmB